MSKTELEHLSMSSRIWATSNLIDRPGGIVQLKSSYEIIGLWDEDWMIFQSHENASEWI